MALEFAAVPLSMWLILLGLALLISAVGFYRVVYFISIGYAFSIVAMAVVSVILLRENLTWAAALQNLLLVIWGLRLGIFLVQRELQPAYGKELAGVHARSAGHAAGAQADHLGWRLGALCRDVHAEPVCPGACAGSVCASWTGLLVQWAGLAIMAGALGMEALADQQKSAFKVRFPGQFCNAGLYRWVRCPNYLGEILFWVGNWVVGLLFYTSPLRWLLAASGLICIVLIMLGSTKRLEAQQDARYGQNQAYQGYVRSTPILIPFVPVYTFHNLRVYLG